mmetsp:Transcript_1096/g.2223  ORF Transcript_1096/g.2223 Transcript_1096/m.2223 type:complete len:290 (-) Transcript_1096:107-976(-)
MHGILNINQRKKMKCTPPIHRHHRPGNITRPLTQQPTNRARNFLRTPKPLGRQRGQDFVHEQIPRRTIILKPRFRPYNSRSDAIYPHSALHPFLTQCNTHIFDSGTSSSTVHHIWHSIPISQGDVDDAPAVISHVVFVGGTADVEGSSEVSLDDGLESFRREFFGGADELTSGVVYEEMEGFVGLYYVFYQIIHLFCISNTRRWPDNYLSHRIRVASFALPPSNNRLVHFLRRPYALIDIPTGNDDCGTEKGQFRCYGATYARSTSCDEGYFSGEEVRAEYALPLLGLV